jgi:hypothetical protein
MIALITQIKMESFNVKLKLKKDQHVIILFKLNLLLDKKENTKGLNHCLLKIIIRLTILMVIYHTNKLLLVYQV